MIYNDISSCAPAWTPCPQWPHLLSRSKAVSGARRRSRSQLTSTKRACVREATSLFSCQELHSDTYTNIKIYVYLANPHDVISARRVVIQKKKKNIRPRLQNPPDAQFAENLEMPGRKRTHCKRTLQNHLFSCQIRVSSARSPRRFPGKSARIRLFPPEFLESFVLQFVMFFHNSLP